MTRISDKATAIMKREPKSKGVSHDRELREWSAVFVCILRKNYLNIISTISLGREKLKYHQINNEIG